MPAGESAEDFADAADSRILLESAMASLSPEQRELLTLVLVVGLTYAEAAAVLEVAEGTVKSRMSRIRAALREQMEGA